MVELYLHSPIGLHGTGTTLPFLPFTDKSASSWPRLPLKQTVLKTLNYLSGCDNLIKRFGAAVSLLTHIQEVLGSYLDRDTDYPY
jgi:hypothetical protein